MARAKVNGRAVVGWLAVGSIIGALLGSGMTKSVQDMVHKEIPGMLGVYMGVGIFFGPLISMLFGVSYYRAGIGRVQIGQAGWTKVILVGLLCAAVGAWLGMYLGFAYMSVVPSGDLVWMVFSIMAGVAGALMPIKWLVKKSADAGGSVRAAGMGG